MPLPFQNLPPSSCHHALTRRKLLIPPGSILFLTTSERVEEDYDLLYQNSVRKYEGDLEH